LSDPVAADPSPRLNVIQDFKVGSIDGTPHARNFPWLYRLPYRNSRDQFAQLSLGHAPKLSKVLHLGRQFVRSTIEPVASVCCPMNAERTTNGVAELPFLDAILLGEEFDPIRRAGSFQFDR
jgi:hypothetical protein